MPHSIDIHEKPLAEASKLVDAATLGNMNNQELKALVQRERAEFGQIGRRQSNSRHEPRLQVGPAV